MVKRNLEEYWCEKYNSGIKIMRYGQTAHNRTVYAQICKTSLTGLKEPGLHSPSLQQLRCRRFFPRFTTAGTVCVMPMKTIVNIS
jgi:hypothetical protein